jgi:NAD(P)-dependent dehydrogenase (short-subunit alcohol dehydrogenase family)
MVTGATSGIGLGTCHLIDSLGGSVIMVGRKASVLSNTQNKLINKSYTEQFDFGQSNQIEEWFESVIHKTGPMSGIIHCAGIQIVESIRTLDVTTVENMFNINVTSGIMLAKCFRKRSNHMENASLVYLSSVMGMVGSELRSAYCASKGAIIAMTKALAIELARDHIRVNCVSPGFVKTNMFDDTKKIIGEEAMSKIEKLHPLGFGEPNDVANAIVFLISSKWMTGTNLTIDGGYTAQ